MQPNKLLLLTAAVCFSTVVGAEEDYCEEPTISAAQTGLVFATVSSSSPPPPTLESTFPDNEAQKTSVSIVSQSWLTGAGQSTTTFLAAEATSSSSRQPISAPPSSVSPAASTQDVISAEEISSPASAHTTSSTSAEAAQTSSRSATPRLTLTGHASVHSALALCVPHGTYCPPASGNTTSTTLAILSATSTVTSTHNTTVTIAKHTTASSNYKSSSVSTVRRVRRNCGGSTSQGIVNLSSTASMIMASSSGGATIMTLETATGPLATSNAVQKTTTETSTPVSSASETPSSTSQSSGACRGAVRPVKFMMILPGVLAIVYNLVALT